MSVDEGLFSTSLNLLMAMGVLRVDGKDVVGQLLFRIFLELCGIVQCFVMVLGATEGKLLVMGVLGVRANGPGGGGGGKVFRVCVDLAADGSLEHMNKIIDSYMGSEWNSNGSNHCHLRPEWPRIRCCWKKLNMFPFMPSKGPLLYFDIPLMFVRFGFTLS